MANFIYKAIDESGLSVEGTLSAPGRQAALEMLRQRKSHPIILQEELSKNVNLKWDKKVKARDLALFCRQFHSMLNAGINILNCLDILRGQLENKRLKKVIEDVYENVQKGLTLSEAMRRNDKVFPELMLSMVSAGEVSGTLDNIMKRLAIHYEKEYKINNKIKGAMVYPIVLTIVAVLVVAFLLTFIMPTFITLYSGSDIELPAITKIVIGISAFLRNNTLWILLALIAIVFVGRRYIQSPEGRRHLDEFKLRLPLIKGLVEKITAARFARTMSTMMVSGIPLLQALESTAGVMNNVVIQEKMARIYDSVRSGKVLSEPVRASGVFPPMISNMVKIGEESGTTDDLLDKAADFFDEEVDNSIQRMTTLFEPAMIVVMGLFIGFIVVAMLMPMFNMGKTFQ